MLRDTEMRLRPSWLLLGPAFVAAIAYVDPGNVAANVSAGRAVRLPAGVGHLPGQRHGGPRPVPVGQTRPGQRAHPARGRRRPQPHPDPDRLLAAGRIGRHGNRSRRGRRRRHRAVPAVRPAAAGRRHHHRRGVAAAAGRAEPPRPTDVRAGDQRPAADHRDRIPRQPVRRTAAGRGRRRRAGAALRRRRERAAGHRDAGRDGDAARRLPALRPGPRPARPPRCRARSAGGCCG